ncbi:MAG: hypothetical protein ACE5GC_01425 [Acidimicrobiia bacterium]
MGARRSPPQLTTGEAKDFFAERIPDEWYVGPVEITFDDVEILVVGEISHPAERDERTLISEHREATRQGRMSIAADAEGAFLRKVAWGARCGSAGVLFSHLSVPAMTRLRLSQRKVLETLVDGGVARSTSDALQWCVRMVERNLEPWLEDLREALTHVEDVRRQGPDGT